MRLKTLILKSLLLFTISLSTYSQSQNLNRKEIYLNRFQISNILIEKFGPASKEVVNKNIFSRPSIFYGPCDIYGQVYKNKKETPTNIYPSSECFSGLTDSKINLNASLNKIRQALMLNTCISLVQNKKSLNYFIKKHNISNKESISKAFYKNEKFKFKNSSNEDAIVEACISKGWQKI